MSFDNHRASAMDGTSSSGNPETQSQAASSVPSLCRMGCGFYANSAFDGMCSKCYKDTISTNQPTIPAVSSASSTVTTSTQTPSVGIADARQSPSVTDLAASSDSPTSVHSVDTATLPDVNTGLPTVRSNASFASSVDSTDTESEVGDSSSESGKEKGKKKRCTLCRKRVGLTGFDCRCGGHFCSMHRYSDTHQCGFDYRALAQSEIRKHNPVVAAEKVKKL